MYGNMSQNYCYRSELGEAEESWWRSCSKTKYKFDTNLNIFESFIIQKLQF